MAQGNSVAKRIKQVQQTTGSFWKQPLFRDRLFVGFVLASGLLCLAVIVLLILNVRPKDFVVPIQYSTLQGFDALGPWYRVYTFGLFSLLVTVGNIILATMSYRRSRMVSFFLVTSTAVINLLTLVIVLTLVSNLDL